MGGKRCLSLEDNMKIRTRVDSGSTTESVASAIESVDGERGEEMSPADAKVHDAWGRVLEYLYSGEVHSTLSLACRKEATDATSAMMFEKDGVSKLHKLWNTYSVAKGVWETGKTIVPEGTTGPVRIKIPSKYPRS